MTEDWLFAIKVGNLEYLRNAHRPRDSELPMMSISAAFEHRQHDVLDYICGPPLNWSFKHATYLEHLHAVLQLLWEENDVVGMKKALSMKGLDLLDTFGGAKKQFSYWINNTTNQHMKDALRNSIFFK